MSDILGYNDNINKKHHAALIQKEGNIYGCTNPIPMAVCHHNRLPFSFVPVTLGLSIFVALLETCYVRTKHPAWKETSRKLVRFFGTLFVINFSMGVVTGIVQEFHFGMNWSEYSRFMGDIFGAPLALEALTAFFLESTFLGIWILAGTSSLKKPTASASGLSLSPATSRHSGFSLPIPSCSIRSASPCAMAVPK